MNEWITVLGYRRPLHKLYFCANFHATKLFSFSQRKVSVYDLHEFITFAIRKWTLEHIANETQIKRWQKNSIKNMNIHTNKSTEGKKKSVCGGKLIPWICWILDKYVNAGYS